MVEIWQEMWVIWPISRPLVIVLYLEPRSQFELIASQLHVFRHNDSEVFDFSIQFREDVSVVFELWNLNYKKIAIFYHNLLDSWADRKHKQNLLVLSSFYCFFLLSFFFSWKNYIFNWTITITRLEIGVGLTWTDNSRVPCLCNRGTPRAAIHFSWENLWWLTF